MRLLEYKAKEILAGHSIAVPKGSIVTADSSTISFPVILKSQVPIGGRGKAGGIQVAKNGEDFSIAYKKILDLEIGGFRPSKILAEDVLDIEKEFYLSIIIERDTSSIQLMAGREGGVEVENAKDFNKWELTNNDVETVGEKLAEYYNLPEQTFVLQDMVKNLFDCFVKNDAILIEINPLVLTKQGKLVAGDCKMELDDAASFRHPEWSFEYQSPDSNFVTLNTEGTVATIANGAGLAMATVDSIANAGLSPANFLDIGGGANEESVLKAFKQIVRYPKVSAIVVDIFAGITRCDEVASAILAAKRNIEHLPRLYVRLAGTNYEEAVDILAGSDVILLPSLEACIDAVKKELV